eukprot:m.301304 g.301304  ORF g.301304 m.301304 type:complete len:114 (+) comp40808_c0_seq2:249-590(+)
MESASSRFPPGDCDVKDKNSPIFISLIAKALLETVKKLDQEDLIGKGEIPMSSTKLESRIEKRLFEIALKEDTSLVNRVRLQIVGKDGVGKTCVKNALLGEKFESNERHHRNG